MTAPRGAWLAVVTETIADAVERAEWRRLPLLAVDRLPSPGDWIVLVRIPRLGPLASAVVTGTAVVQEIVSGGDLRIRHRFVAPKSHEPRVAQIPRLVAALGWTDTRARALIGSLVGIGAEDFRRVEQRVRAEALSFGPPPKRPQHRQPRTPGRRAAASSRVPPRA